MLYPNRIALTQNSVSSNVSIPRSTTFFGRSGAKTSDTCYQSNSYVFKLDLVTFSTSREYHALITVFVAPIKPAFEHCKPPQSVIHSNLLLTVEHLSVAGSAAFALLFLHTLLESFSLRSSNFCLVRPTNSIGVLQSRTSSLTNVPSVFFHSALRTISTFGLGLSYTQ